MWRTTNRETPEIEFDYSEMRMALLSGTTLGPREHLGQLGNDDPFGAPVVTGVAGDEMSVEEDGAVIVDGDDLQTRRTRRDVREERGGKLEHVMIIREHK